MPLSTSVEFVMVGSVCVVYLPAELMDEILIAQSKEQIFQYVEEHRPAKLLIDFDHVHKFGSPAVGNLIALRKLVLDYHGELKLCSMGETTREIFDICGLIGPVFDEVYPSANDAIQSFGS